jgi:hypothetical protein
MRKLILISALAFVFAGCSKDENDPEPPPPPPPPTPTEMLTDNTWQIDHLIQQYGNVQSTYVRGGTNTTGSNYSIVRLSFDEDGTGSFTDPLNATYDLDWEWVGTTNTKMTVVVDYPVPQTLTYSFVSVSEDRFNYTTNYQENTTFALATATLIPAP